MSFLPLYKPANDAYPHPSQIPQHANVGLWYTHFFNQYTKDCTLDATGKKKWIDSFIGTHGAPEILSDFLERQQVLAAHLNAEIRHFKSEWHFISGIGNSHPVENGMRWHHTLGLPYLPAKSLKGLMQQWVNEWMDDADKDPNLAGRWFGKGASATDNNTGSLIFFDAIPTAPVRLTCDITTPHMGSWYTDGQQISEDNFATHAPADWHSPVPIYFLAVKDISLFTMIAPRASNCKIAKADAKKAMMELEKALEWLGAGAKTALGYGRFTVDRKAQHAQETKARETALKLNSL